MKTSVCAMFLFTAMLNLGCDSPTENNVKNNIRNDYGTVQSNGLEILAFGEKRLYVFGAYGGPTPKSLGFDLGDKVYFEADVKLSNYNQHQERMVYWAILISIASYSLPP